MNRHTAFVHCVQTMCLATAVIATGSQLSESRRLTGILTSIGIATQMKEEDVPADIVVGTIDLVSFVFGGLEADIPAPDYIEAVLASHPELRQALSESQSGS
jgi:hypothetical protein